jgi:hypothetical protein
MKALALGLTLCFLVACGGGGSSSTAPAQIAVNPPAVTAPPTLAPTATPSATSAPTSNATVTPQPTLPPTAVPSPTTASSGLFLYGNPNFTSLGQTNVFFVSEPNGASAAGYTATLNAACKGAASVTPQPGAAAFNVTALQNSTSCIITFTSNATGATGSVAVTIAAPSATATPIPV